MHTFLYIFIIAIVNNIDNISVRVTYALRGIKVDIFKNLLIAFITFFVSTLVATFGNLILKYISLNICNIIIMIVFIVLGFGFIFEPYIKKKKANTYIDIITNPEDADIDNSKTIDIKEALFLGIALNINNIGGCFNAGVLGLDNYLIGILSAMFSFLTFWLGNYFVPIFKKVSICKKINFIAGILFIVIGIKQIL